MICECAILALLAAVFLIVPVSASQTPAASPVASATAHTISGIVKSGATPLPGASVSAANTLTGKKVVSSTDVDGSFSLAVPSTGRYVVRVELAAFAIATKEVVLNAAAPSAKIDVELSLLSRVTTPAEAAPAQRVTSAAPGVQRLEVSEDASLADSTAGGANHQAEAPLPGMPALGTSSDATNESVAISGAMGNTADWARTGDDIHDRIQEMRDRGDLPMGDGGRMLVLGGPGGPGGFGGGGGFANRGGPGGGMMRSFNVNRPHGSIFYSMGNAALDAAPYALSGAPADKPDYGSSRFGATVGGPLNIPKLFNGGSKTFFFVNVAGTRATSPYDVFSTVPTLAERNGDFSAFLPTQSGPLTSCTQALSPADVKAGNFILCNRATGQPFPNNTIPAIDPAAQALLQYVPLPNVPGAAQNFRYLTSGDTNGLNISGRVIHNFGDVQRGRGNRGGRGGRNRNNVNFGFNYSSNNSDLLRAFPTIGGTTKTQGWNVNGGDTWSRGKWTNQFRANFNQNHTETTNQFAGLVNVAALAGITGVSQDPQDWGVPTLSFSHFTGLSDISPLARRDRVFQLTDTVIWNRGKHTFRFGGDYRRLYTQLDSSANARGTFTFTGFATAAFGPDGRPLPGTGYDFADFLIGAAQQTSIQYSPNTYNFAANGWDLFVQDAWRFRSNLSFDLGLRYEYISPYTEAKDRLVNLDSAPGFTAVAAVQPDGTGAYTGMTYPASLVKPDRNNFAPRLGVAWKPHGNTVVRAGYGVNYNLGQYKSIVQQLAFQPPFSYTATNMASALQPLTLENGFPTPAPGVLTNNYAVDPNYVLGYVQMWNLNIQQELTKSLVLNVGYNGSKGTALDIVRAPNRGPLGLQIEGVQSFLWESSQGDSILHAGSVRLNKRMSKGLSVGATYVFSKSIDNASSIGGSAVVVAQNDLDLAAERGLSSFDQRHRLTGNWVYELPFGTGKALFDKGGALARIVGDWTWSGSFTIASGTPWTARIIGDFADVARGSNGSLRADYNGLPIALANPTISEWFNTAAFSVPAHGQFGDAGRNTIIGPGSVVFNMSLGKSFPMKDMMGLEVRLQATNVFNTPQYTAIDTVVNSPTFGQVRTVGSMRKLQVLARFRF